MAETDFRAQERTPETKAFFFISEDYNGAQNVEKIKPYQDYTDIKDAHAHCLLYANSYAQTLLKRVKLDKGDEFFQEAGVSRNEMATQIVNNICLRISKTKAQVHRQTVAKISQKQSLNDDIRRLYNGGDRFHPYL